MGGGCNSNTALEAWLDGLRLRVDACAEGVASEVRIREACKWVLQRVALQGADWGSGLRALLIAQWHRARVPKKGLEPVPGCRKATQCPCPPTTAAARNQHSGWSLSCRRRGKILRQRSMQSEALQISATCTYELAGHHMPAAQEVGPCYGDSDSCCLPVPLTVGGDLEKQFNGVLASQNDKGLHLELMGAMQLELQKRQDRFLCKHGREAKTSSRTPRHPSETCSARWSRCAPSCCGRTG